MDDYRPNQSYGKGKQIACARITLYFLTVALGFGVAGIVGTHAVKNFNGGPCLITTRIQQEPCSCTTSADCDGQTCNAGECPFPCFDVGKMTVQDQNTCKYVVGLSGSLAALAVFMIAYHGYNIWKTRVSALKASWTGCLSAAFNGLCTFFVLVGAIIYSVSLKKLCDSGDRYSSVIGTCQESFPGMKRRVDLNKRFYDDFYNAIFAGELMLWMLFIVWFLLTAISGIRFWWLNKQVKYKTFVNRQEPYAMPEDASSDHSIKPDPNFPTASPDFSTA